MTMIKKPKEMTELKRKHEQQIRGILGSKGISWVSIETPNNIISTITGHPRVGSVESKVNDKNKYLKHIFKYLDKP